VRSSLLGEFRKLALSLDLDPFAILKRAGIDRRLLNDPDLTVPARAMMKLLELAALTSGIEDFGLRLAEVRGLPDLGPLTLMLREEATVRAALKTLISLFHLHSDAIYMNLAEGSNPIITVDIIVVDTNQCRQAIDLSVASITSIVRWLLGENWSPTAVCFTHARPASRARFDRYFRCPLDFSHEFNGVILRREDLDRAVPASSPALRRQVQRYIRSINVAPSDAYVHRVTQLLTVALPKGEAKADIIARCLGTNRRTLNRRLARNGINYSSVVVSVRKNLAAQYMLGSERPLSDIAGLLGFGSLSAFTQWFRHEFDCTPSTWRKTERAKSKH
jgi:AraC-like DNA-binding protein